MNSFTKPNSPKRLSPLFCTKMKKESRSLLGSENDPSITIPITQLSEINYYRFSKQTRYLEEYEIMKIRNYIMKIRIYDGIQKFSKTAKCCHYYVKEVEILDYSGGERVDDLIKHVIKNALRLEKIVIDPRRYRPYPVAFPFPGDIEVETNNRIHALEKLKPKVPSTIEFVCCETIMEDKISELPDEILVDILYCLSLREAVASSNLSRRWRYVWKSTLKLNFDPLYIIHNLHTMYPWHTGELERMKYVNWVDSVLKKHTCPKINHFRICFHLQDKYRFHIDKWIKFAMKKKVNNLELDLIFADYDATLPLYKFPLSLVFDNCIGFESLQVFDFKSVNISGEVIEHLLANCPLLERLVVWHSYELWDVRVYSSVLKHLEIRQCGKIKSIEVSAANLVSFYFDGYGIFSLRLKNVPKLDEVSISWSNYKNMINSAFNLLSCCLSQLEILKFEIGSEKFKKNQVIPTSTNLKHLQLEVDVAESSCLLQLNSFMKAFPKMQKLVLVVGLLVN